MADNNKDDVKFDPSIEMDLGDNPGVVEFRSSTEFQEWVQVDIDFWNNCFEKFAKTTSQRHILNMVNVAKKGRDQLLNEGGLDVRQINKPSDIYSFLENYKTGRLLHSDSVIARHIENLALKNDQDELPYYLTAANSGEVPIQATNIGQFDLNRLIRAGSIIGAFHNPSNNTYLNDLRSMTDQGREELDVLKNQATDASALYNNAVELMNNEKGIVAHIGELENKLEREIEKALSPQKSKIDTSIKDIEARISTLGKIAEQGIDTVQENLDNSLATMKENANDHVNAFINTIKDTHNFKIAEDFWNKKRRRHVVACLFSGFVFVIGVSATIGLTVMYGPRYLELIGVLGNSYIAKPFEFNIPLSLFALIPVIGVFWVLRQALKVFLLNLSQYSDADERIAMTETFMTLQSQGNLTKEDRILIIQALFRPGPDTNHEDGAAPPHIFEFLTKKSD